MDTSSANVYTTNNKAYVFTEVSFFIDFEWADDAWNSVFIIL